jgi:hypothetical protein
MHISSMVLTAAMAGGSVVRTAAMAGALVGMLWLGGGGMAQGHDVAAQVTPSLVTAAPAVPMVAPVPAVPQPSLPSTPIATLTDVQGVVAQVYVVQGQVIVVSNVGVAISQDLTPATSTETATR